MGVCYSLNDPARGECFDFGKGWTGDAETDYEPAPARDPAHPPGCPHCGKHGYGYRWTPLASRDETLHYVTSHFYFLRAEPHDADCSKGRCVAWCEHHEPDLEYAGRFADLLWAWLEGRDQSQLDVNHDSGDDIHCHPDEPETHEKWCSKIDPWTRHFFVTGSRYEEDQERLVRRP